MDKHTEKDTAILKEWYCYINNQQCGPYSEELLFQLVNSGQLTIDTLVYNTDPENAAKGWLKAIDTEISTLFPPTVKENTVRSWYCFLNGQSQGPFFENQLKVMIKNGLLTSESLVWTENMSDWTKLSNSELYDFLNSTVQEKLSALGQNVTNTIQNTVKNLSSTFDSICGETQNTINPSAQEKLSALGQNVTNTIQNTVKNLSSSFDSMRNETQNTVTKDKKNTYHNAQSQGSRSAEYFDRRKQRSRTKTIVASIVLLLLIVSGIVGGYFFSHSNAFFAQTGNKIRMQSSAKELKGKNYQQVQAQLQTSGFTNIETKVLNDLITGWLTKDGEVENVSVNGNVDFLAGSKFPKDARIVITYHTFPASSVPAETPEQQEARERARLEEKAAKAEARRQEIEAREEAQRKAEEAAKKAKEARVNQLEAELSELTKYTRSKFDEIENLILIYDKTTPESFVSNNFYAYLVAHDNDVVLRLVMGFQRSDWVFVERIQIRIDNNEYFDVRVPYDVKSEIIVGGIREWVDLKAKKHEKMIKAISNGKKVLVRYKGDTYQYDVMLGEQQKAALKRMCRLYEVLKEYYELEKSR